MLNERPGQWKRKVSIAFSIEMRIDLFLKASRLIPRRSLAQEFCDAGRVRVNGKRAKSSKEVNAGDEIVITRRGRITKVAVVALPSTKQVAKASAAELYRVIEETPVDELF